MPLKDYMWAVGAIIYVGLMFPIFYAYAFLHWNDFQISSSGLLYPSEVGAFILLAQMFISAILKDPNPNQRTEEKIPT